MEINGLTLHILPVDDEFPDQDRETALLNWLLAEWHKQQNQVDMKNSMNDNRPHKL